MSETSAASALPLNDPRAYADARRFCDIVMKGGITSGVAYPLGVCELARTYSFKSIGGASAGAIAAAAAAAAEYQRRTGASAGDGAAGYARLAALPGWLARDGNLGHLFQANPPTKPLYNLLTTSLEVTGGGFKKALALICAAWRNFPQAAFIGVVVGCLLVLPLVGASLLLGSRGDATGLAARALLFGYGSLFILAFIAIVASIFVAFGVGSRVGSGLSQNFYGLTTGLLDPEGNDARPVLTTWLADEIDRIAGKPARTAPLTFGDLWGAASNLDQQCLPRAEWGVRLQMMTTNLTLGRPYRLPFDDESTEYFYDPAEWAEILPRLRHAVVGRPPTPVDADHAQAARRAGGRVAEFRAAQAAAGPGTHAHRYRRANESEFPRPHQRRAALDG